MHLIKEKNGNYNYLLVLICFYMQRGPLLFIVYLTCSSVFSFIQIYTTYVWVMITKVDTRRSVIELHDSTTIIFFLFIFYYFIIKF